MTIQVQGPEGSSVQFPDGTDAATIHQVMTQHFAPSMDDEVAKRAAGLSVAELTPGQKDIVTRYGAPQSSQDAVAQDVVKSGLSGFGKGVSALIGLPADLGDLNRHFSELVADRLGFPAASSQSLSDLASGKPESHILPTSQQVQSTIEGVTGAFHQPETTAGRYAETAGEFVPGAMIGPGGMLQKAARFGVVPGVASEAAGQATEGTALEPWARAGAGIAAGVGAGATMRPGTPERAIRAQLPDYVTPQAIHQADALVQDAAGRGVNLTWPEALSQATGRPVLTDMQRLLESSRRTRSTMQDFLGDRPQQMDTAARAEIGNVAPATNAPSTIGPAVGRAAEGTVNDVQGAINTASRPLYQAAEAQRIPPREFAALSGNPVFVEGLERVRNDPWIGPTVAHLPDNSVQVVDAVKQLLDETGRNLRNPGNASRSNFAASVVGRGNETAVAAADRATGSRPGVTGDYETARLVQQHARETYLEPLMQGPIGKLADRDLTTKNAIEALFPSKPLAGSEQEVSTAVSALSQRNPWAARQLVRAHLEQKLNEAFDAAGRGQEAAQFAGAGFANRVAGSSVVLTQRLDNLRSAIEALPGGQRLWPGVQRFIEIAQATGTRQPIGSKTAFNEQDLKAMGTGGALANLGKLAGSPGEWTHWLHDAWGRWQMGSNLDELARIITDPQAAPLLQRIAQLPQGARAAQLLSARLVATGRSSQIAPQTRREDQ